MNTRAKAQYVGLSLLSPVLAIYFALKSKSEKLIVFAGTVFFGIVGSTFIYLEGNDGHTHLINVYRYYIDMSVWNFFNDLFKLITFEPTDSANDAYLHIISYLAGGVLQLPELIHVFGGFILGYFFTKSVMLVLEDKPPYRLGFLLTGMIIFFLMKESITALNPLRMWIAMWVFFYGALAYVKRGDYKYLWIIGLSIFIHFSYLLYIIPLAAAILLRRRKLIVVGIFIFSFSASVGFDQISGIVESTGLYQDKAKYTVVDENTLERRAMEREGQAKGNFYKELGPKFFNGFGIFTLAFVLITVYLRNKNLEHIDFLIAGGLLIFSLANFSSLTSPAVYGRGLAIAGEFLIASSVIVLSKQNLYFRQGFIRMLYQLSYLVFLVSTIPYILFQISYIFNTVSLFIVFMPIASWLLGDNDFSIRDFLIFDF